MKTNLTETTEQEWLEADGLGGFASGTASGIRTRRYHALLLAATQPPAGRVVLVNGFDAELTNSSGTHAISSQRYSPEVVHPDGIKRLAGFEFDPWPRWTFALADGTEIQQEIFAVHGAPVVVLSWRLTKGSEETILTVRPFLSGRDYHALHHENSAFQFQPERIGQRLIWRPYPGLPAITAVQNGTYHHQPDWYRNFAYERERERGLDFTEDLAMPGIFQFDLAAGEAVFIFTADELTRNGDRDCMPEKLLGQLRESAQTRRSAFPNPLERAADAYVVERGTGKTIVAGYPWFTDWGRDTFIALRGLCLATGRVEVARDVLLEWSNVVSEGMLPNRFSDQGDLPEYNSVDASLWFIIAVHELLAVARNHGIVSQAQRQSLQTAVEEILTGYSRGTRYGIRADADGLLAAGVPGAQLTWMDAKVGDWVVTPRIGKPVEVQALWLNALWIASRSNESWKGPLAHGLESFQRRFWNSDGGCLFDVVDVDHESGKLDATFRPNQIFAVGGLPLQLTEGKRAEQIVHSVECRLWTPLGLRSLAPGEPGYTPRYQGGARERDGAYHQGTGWPWLIGPFVEAWIRVRGSRREAKRAARRRFVTPLFEHLEHAGLGHVSEIADAEPPHTPRGCPFQAWSLAELIRLDRIVLA
jgi:predicted glycogen debranching enzyme